MILVKFTNYADEFMRGNLYFNSLEYFWKHGFEGQADVCEGISGNVYLDSVKDLFPADMRDFLVQDIGLQAVGYASCNILCMSRIDVFPIMGGFGFTTPSNMQDFGERAIVITCFSEFINRVERAFQSNGFKYVCGDVMYHNPSENGKDTKNKSKILWKTTQPVSLNMLRNPKIQTIRDSFDKHSKYSYQKEWRISLFRGNSDASPYTLKIGDISDIALNVTSREMTDNEFVEHLIEEFNYDNPGYFGNVLRDGLRKRFIKNGDNMYWFFVNI